MSESKHTAGPWEWARKPDGDFGFLKGDGLYVIAPEHDTADYGLRVDTWLDVSEANAQLIAAAPDMLKALREVRRYVAETRSPSPGTVLTICDAAIAKATRP